MGDFAVILANFAIEPGPQKHTDSPESIFIAASKAGWGSCRLMNGGRAAQTCLPLPSGPAPISVCLAPTPARPLGHSLGEVGLLAGSGSCEQYSLSLPRLVWQESQNSVGVAARAVEEGCALAHLRR